MKSALIVVDIQNDFLPGGALAVTDGDRIIDAINQLQKLFDVVVFTQDWHPENHVSFAANHLGKNPFDVVTLNDGVTIQTLWPVHCVQFSVGAYLSDKLKNCSVNGAALFRKGEDSNVDSYSGFFDNNHTNSTGLEAWLKKQKVTDVYVCGLATDYCVKFTALDAIKLGFTTYFIEDASKGVAPESVATAIEEMKTAGIEVVQSYTIKI